MTNTTPIFGFILYCGGGRSPLTPRESSASTLVVVLVTPPPRSTRSLVLVLLLAHHSLSPLFLMLLEPFICALLAFLPLPRPPAAPLVHRPLFIPHMCIRNIAKYIQCVQTHSNIKWHSQSVSQHLVRAGIATTRNTPRALRRAVTRGRRLQDKVGQRRAARA